MVGCDWCHTSVPDPDYPRETELPDGETAVLCLHCRVSARTEDYSLRTGDHD